VALTRAKTVTSAAVNMAVSLSLCAAEPRLS
jgi:hypothetical protein